MKITSFNQIDRTDKSAYINKSKNYKTGIYKNNIDTVSFGNSKDISIVGKNFKNKIKIVFSDVDGTISEFSDIITDKTLSAINFLHNNEVPVILTTARCYKDTLPIIKQFSHNPDYSILLQGGEIIDKDGKILLKNSIPHSIGRKLITWSDLLKKQEKNSELIMYFNNEAYSAGSVKFPWKTACQIHQINSFDNLFNNNQTLQKAMMYLPNAYDNPYLSNSLSTSFHNTNINGLDLKLAESGFHEIQNKSVSKDKAIDYILKTLNIDAKNTMVIGDSSNDIEMLDFIRDNNGLAIAMGNAADNVKNHANAVTNNIRNEGFYNAVIHLFSNF